MFQGTDLVHADGVPIEGTTVSDVDMDHLDEYFTRGYGETIDDALEKTPNSSVSRLLNNLGLAQEERLNLFTH